MSLNVIHEGLPAGGALNKLVMSNWDPRVLRPWMDDDGRCFYDGQAGSVRAAMAGTATLRKDEWLKIDETVIEVAQNRLRGIRDLQTYGLVKNLPGAMGMTVYAWETITDLSGPEANMDMVSRARNERLEYDMESIPLPVLFKDYEINARFLAVSRRDGSGIDTIAARLATQKVVQGMEDRLFNGWDFTYAGYTLYGYRTYPKRNTGNLLGSWTASATTGVMKLQDILNGRQKLRDNKMFGNFIVYVPSTYEIALAEDYKSESDKTVKQRILEVDGLVDIKVSDYLPNDEIILVHLDKTTVTLINGMDPTPIQWDTEGGTRLHHKILALSVVKFATDSAGNCGLVHLVAP